MTTALTINIVLAAVVLAAVVGAIAWSIATQNVDAPTRIVRGARQRRRTSAQARFVGRTVENRA